MTLREVHRSRISIAATLVSSADFPGQPDSHLPFLLSLRSGPTADPGHPRIACPLWFEKSVGNESKFVSDTKISDFY